MKTDAKIISEIEWAVRDLQQTDSDRLRDEALVDLLNFIANGKLNFVCTVLKCPRDSRSAINHLLRLRKT